MWTIFKREFRSYFNSPLGYVFMGGFCGLSSIFFLLINILNPRGGSPEMNITLGNMKLVLLFVIPALTMKLIAEDRKTKVDQLLFTSPVSVSSIVFGKFFAACAVFLVTMVLFMIYPAILFLFGSPQIPALINAYLGFFLLGLTFISMCLFASALTDNQVIAFIIGFCGILSLWILGFIRGMIGNEFLIKILDWISILKRYDDFSQGVFKVSSIVYYISVIVLFVFLTIRAVEKRRWSEG